jgi:hypothetical protein
MTAGLNRSATTLVASEPETGAEPSSTGRRPVPALIKRNTLLLALAQAFVGMGTQQLVPTLGRIMIERLLGSLALRLTEPRPGAYSHPTSS